MLIKGLRGDDRIGQNRALTEIGSNFVSFCLARVVLGQAGKWASWEWVDSICLIILGLGRATLRQSTVCA